MISFMSKKSIHALTEMARPLLKEHSTLSTAYLMRKFKVNYEEAQKIITNLGLPIFVNIDSVKLKY